jgi:hypothetical protein
LERLESLRWNDWQVSSEYATFLPGYVKFLLILQYKKKAIRFQVAIFHSISRDL